MTLITGCIVKLEELILDYNKEQYFLQDILNFDERFIFNFVVSPIPIPIESQISSPGKSSNIVFVFFIGFLIYLTNHMICDYFQHTIDQINNGKECFRFFNIEREILSQRKQQKSKERQKHHQDSDFNQLEKQQQYIDVEHKMAAISQELIPDIDVSIKLFQNIKWKDIKVGDILLLEENQQVPADVLILDMEKKICFADEMYLTGNSQNKMKESPSQTFITPGSRLKGNNFQFRKILTGLIEFSDPPQHCDDIQGFFQLAQDPAGQNFGIDNILLRGTTLKSVQWAFCIVIYTGMETFQYRKWMVDSNLKRKSFFYDKAGLYFFFLAFFSIFIYNSISVFQFINFNKIATGFNQSFEYPSVLVLQYAIPVNFVIWHDLYMLMISLVQLFRFLKSPQSQFPSQSIDNSRLNFKKNLNFEDSINSKKDEELQLQKQQKTAQNEKIEKLQSLFDLISFKNMNDQFLGDISMCNKLIIEKNSVRGGQNDWNLCQIGINTYKLYDIEKNNLKNLIESGNEKFPQKYMKIRDDRRKKLKQFEQKLLSNEKTTYMPNNNNNDYDIPVVEIKSSNNDSSFFHKSANENDMRQLQYPPSPKNESGSLYLDKNFQITESSELDNGEVFDLNNQMDEYTPDAVKVKSSLYKFFSSDQINQSPQRFFMHENGSPLTQPQNLMSPKFQKVKDVRPKDDDNFEMSNSDDENNDQISIQNFERSEADSYLDDSGDEFQNDQIKTEQTSLLKLNLQSVSPHVDKKSFSDKRNNKKIKQKKLQFASSERSYGQNNFFSTFKNKEKFQTVPSQSDAGWTSSDPFKKFLASENIDHNHHPIQQIQADNLNIFKITNEDQNLFKDNSVSDAANSNLNDSQQIFNPQLDGFIEEQISKQKFIIESNRLGNPRIQIQNQNQKDRGKGEQDLNASQSSKKSNYNHIGPTIEPKISYKNESIKSNNNSESDKIDQEKQDNTINQDFENNNNNQYNQHLPQENAISNDQIKIISDNEKQDDQKQKSNNSSFSIKNQINEIGGQEQREKKGSFQRSFSSSSLEQHGSQNSFERKRKNLLERRKIEKMEIDNISEIQNINALDSKNDEISDLQEKSHTSQIKQDSIAVQPQENTNQQNVHIEIREATSFSAGTMAVNVDAKGRGKRTRQTGLLPTSNTGGFPFMAFNNQNSEEQQPKNTPDQIFKMKRAPTVFDEAKNEGQFFKDFMDEFDRRHKLLSDHRSKLDDSPDSSIIEVTNTNINEILICLCLCHQTHSSMSYNRKDRRIEWNSFYDQNIDQYILQTLKQLKYEFVCSYKSEEDREFNSEYVYLLKILDQHYVRFPIVKIINPTQKRNYTTYIVGKETASSISKLRQKSQQKSSKISIDSRAQSSSEKIYNQNENLNDEMISDFPDDPPLDIGNGSNQIYRAKSHQEFRGFQRHGSAQKSSTPLDQIDQVQEKLKGPNFNTVEEDDEDEEEKICKKKVRYQDSIKENEGDNSNDEIIQNNFENQAKDLRTSPLASALKPSVFRQKFLESIENPNQDENEKQLENERKNSENLEGQNRSESENQEDQDSQEFEQGNKSFTLYLQIYVYPGETIPDHFNLSKNDLEFLNFAVQSLFQEGNIAIVYLSKQVDEVTVQSFIQDFQANFNIPDNEHVLDNLKNSLESDLKLLGVIGMKQRLQKGIENAFQLLQNSNLQLCLVSGDYLHTILANCLYLDLIPKESQQIIINADNYDDIQYLIRTQLNNIKAAFFNNQNQVSNMQSKGKSEGSGKNPSSPGQNMRRRSTLSNAAMDSSIKYSIIVSGDSLQIIKSDDYLKQHFTLLCYFSKGLAVFRAEIEEREFFVEVIQKIDKTGRVICLGKNAKFLNQGDVSFQIFENFDFQKDLIQNKKNFPYLQCGFLVSNFQLFLRTMLSVGFNEGRNFQMILNYSVNRANSLFFLLIVIYSSDSGDYIDSIGLPIHMYYHIVGFFFNILIFQISNYQEIYIDKKADLKTLNNQRLLSKNFQNNIKTSFFFNILFSVLQVFAIAGFTFYYEKFDIHQADSGKNYSFITMIEINIFFLTFFSYLKIYFFLNAFPRPMICLLHFILFIINLVLYYAARNSQPDFFGDEMLMIFSSISFYFLVAFFVLLYCLVNIFFNDIVNNFQLSSIDLERVPETFRLIVNWASMHIDLMLIVYKKRTFNFITILNSLFENKDQMDIILLSMMNPQDVLVSKASLNQFSLLFENEDLERKFKNQKVNKKVLKRQIINAFIFLFIDGFFLTDTIYETVQNTIHEEFQLVFMVILIILSMLHILNVVFAFNSNNYISRLFDFQYTRYIFIVLFCVFYSLQELGDNQGIPIASFQILLSINMIIRSDLIIAGQVLLLSLGTGLQIHNTFVKEEYNDFGNFTFSRFLFILLFISGWLFNEHYNAQQRQRLNFVERSKLTSEFDREKEVLSLLLPKFIRERISADSEDYAISEKQDAVAIIFCDIANFDYIMSQLNERIVKLLDKLFRVFDQLCNQNGLQKIETVGQTYMACAGLEACEYFVNPKVANYHIVHRAINMAQQMNDFVQTVKWGQNRSPLKLKIGIHYGPVITGVIGYHQPQFSLIGDTVNTTSRVCSKGKQESVTISQQAFQKVQGSKQLIFSQPREEFAQGKGNIVLYQVYHQSNSRFNNTSDTNNQSAERKGSLKYRKNSDSPKLRQQMTSNKEISFRDRKTEIPKSQKPFNDGEQISIQLIENASTPQNSDSMHQSKDLNQNKQENELVNDNGHHRDLIVPSAQSISVPMPEARKRYQTVTGRQFEKPLQEPPLRFSNNINNKRPHPLMIGPHSSRPPSPEQQELEKFMESPAIQLQQLDFGGDTSIQNFQSQDLIDNIDEADKSQSPMALGIGSRGMLSSLQKIYLPERRGSMLKINLQKVQNTPETGQLEDDDSHQKVFNFNQHEIKNNISYEEQKHHNQFEPETPGGIKKDTRKYSIPSSQQQTKGLDLRRMLVPVKSKQPSGDGAAFESQNNLNSGSNNQILLNIGRKKTVPNLKNNTEAPTPLQQNGNGMKSGSENWLVDLEDQMVKLYGFSMNVPLKENLIDDEVQLLLAQELLFKNEEIENQQKLQYLNLDEKKLFTQFQEEDAVLAEQFYESLFFHFQRIGLSSINYIFVLIVLCALFIVIFDRQFQYWIYFFVSRFIIAFVNLGIFQRKLPVSEEDETKQWVLFLLVSYVIFSVIITAEASFINTSTPTLTFGKGLVVETYILEIFIIFCIVSSFSFLKLKIKLVFLSIYIISYIVIISTSPVVSQYTIYFIFLSSLFRVLTQYMNFLREIEYFNNLRTLDYQKNRQSNLLQQLLPSHILESILNNQGDQSLVDIFSNATLLFSDITDFTQYSSSVQPEQVVIMLRNMFTQFDKKCLENSVFKLYTIGDCYVVFGVINAQQRNPALEAFNVLRMAFEMIEIIKEVRDIINFPTLNMRIGVHTVDYQRQKGGITGTDIVRYDLYGTDVMIANKMESNGEPGRILVSLPTQTLIESQYPNEYNFIPHDSVNIASINKDIPTYFVEPFATEFANVNDQIN